MIIFTHQPKESIMINRIASIALLVLLSTAVNANTLVKKSASGICHAPDSPYYDKVGKYVPFNSLKQCLKTENARLPRGYESSGEISPVELFSSNAPVNNTQIEVAPTFATSNAQQGWPTNNTYNDEIIKLDYSGFTVWLNCDKRGAEYFRYSLTKDKGNLDRSDSFRLDPKVPKRCQQEQTDTYKKRNQMWHRGHQVPANNLDDNAKGIYESNYMTNIMPQTGVMNTGAWYQTEYITECYRDISDITVYGGVVWGDDTSNDHFVRSHGVITPDAFYKILVRHDNNDAIAWVVPNDFIAKKDKLDDYIVSVASVEKIAGIEFPISTSGKNSVARKSWSIPRGCGRG